MKIISFITVCIFLATCACAQDFSWAPDDNCKVNIINHDRLYPRAIDALKNIYAVHRVTQTINYSTEPSNYHNKDSNINGVDVTGAVDISVKCLANDDIRKFLSSLANAGFIAWYRYPGQDRWSGDKHIHAVWVADKLKRQLRKQVYSWMEGKNGLITNSNYNFWTPNKDQIDRIKLAFEKANK